MRWERSGASFGRPRMIGLLAAGILCLGAATAWGAGVEIALLPSPAQVLPGGIFDLEITVPVAGDSLNGYETTIQFDPAVLDFIELSPISLQEGELMTSACSNRWHLFDETDGVITISHVLLCSGKKVAGPGVLYRLRFQAHDTTAVTTVAFTALEVYDAGTYVLPVTSHDAEVRIGSTTGIPVAGSRSGLRAPAPNPFHAATRFAFTARVAGTARLDVYSVTGRRVRRLWDGSVQEGAAYTAVWDGRDDVGRRVGAGVYLARLSGAGGSEVRRVVYLP